MMKMNLNRLIIILLVFPIFFTGCGKDDNNCQILFQWTTNFEFDMRLNADLFSAQIVDVMNVPGLFQAQLDAQGLTRADVGSIQAREMTIIAIFNDFRLNFIDRIDVNVFESGNTSSDIEIGFREPVEASTDFVIEIFPSLLDATALLEQEFLNFRIEYGVRSTNQPVRARLEIRMQACSI